MGEVGLVGGPPPADVLADALDLVVVAGVAAARERGRRIRQELRAVAERERRHVLELRFEHRRERRRGRFPHARPGRGAERIHGGVPVVRARLEDDVAHRAAERHAGVLGVAVGDGRERVREPGVERRLVGREERDEHLVRGGGGGGLGVGAAVVERRGVGLVAGLGAVDGVVLCGVHDGQDPREPERVLEGLGARGVVPVANDLARGGPRAEAAAGDATATASTAAQPVMMRCMLVIVVRRTRSSCRRRRTCRRAAERRWSASHASTCAAGSWPVVATSGA